MTASGDPVPEVKSLRPTHPTIRILAKGKCTTGRIWTYVRDYAHLVIMRSSQEQELIAIGFSDDFRLANCA